MVLKCHFYVKLSYFIIIVTVFFEKKGRDNIFDHQHQAVDPQHIDNDIVFVVHSEAKQRPSDEDDVLHIVEKEDARAVELFEYATHR